MCNRIRKLLRNEWAKSEHLLTKATRAYVTLLTGYSPGVAAPG